MMNVLWLVGMLYASQWGSSAPLNNTEKLLPGAATITSDGDLEELLFAQLRKNRRFIHPSVAVEIHAKSIKGKTLYDVVFKRRSPDGKSFDLVVQAKEADLVIVKTQNKLKVDAKECHIFVKDSGAEAYCERQVMTFDVVAEKIQGQVKADHRIIACWDARVHLCDDTVNPRSKLSMLKGSVYLYCGQTSKTICVNGQMLVEARDRDGRKVAQWQFDAATLEKLKRSDLIGIGYTLCLPLDQRCLAEKDLRLTLRYCADDGKTCCDEPTRVTLRTNPAEVMQAVHLQPIPVRDDRKDAQVEFAVILAHVKSSAANRAKLALQKELAGDGNPKVGFGVVLDKNALLGSLRAMRAADEAKILAEPRIRSLSGQTAHFISGGQVPIVQTNAQGMSNVSYWPLGIKMNLQAKMLGDGKLLLDVGAEIAQLAPANDLITANPLTIIPGMKTKACKVSMQVHDGQTIYVVLPEFNQDKGKSEDLIILVTVRVVEPTYPVASPKASRQVTVTDVVTLSKRGISDDIIIRQMELTESIYDLTTAQILSLHEHGVSNAVIRAMQERRMNSTGAACCTPRAVPAPVSMPR
jgi:hypothetical protein